MTAPPDDVPESSRAPEPAPTQEPEPAPAVEARAIADICPYLLASQGGWRAASPNRDHRCTAVDPPTPLPSDKQRNLCLVAAHHGCPAYRAARVARASMLAPGADPSTVAAADAARRPVARTTAVVLEQPRLAIGGLGTGGVGLYQVVLVALMILAFVVVIGARLSTPSAPVVVATPSPTATATPTPRATPRPTPTPSSTPAGSGLLPSGSATAPSAGAFKTTYRVEAGDTLVGIASEFGTTVGAIQDLNQLTGSDLRIGQLLKIP
ncbi:MAG TPA: LysM peptidoglycan-binding domain-containing protein [Candidatus Limnocylindrales bacterium]|nr:LysM peptidoglycan-binding domain-containing protein [Candidatus Limnocylindrales bacterium]